MSLKGFLYEYRRRQRIKNPEKSDYCSYLLIGIMGADWWIDRGFYREYAEGRCYIDFANPDLKLAIEGDGERYHMDVLRDERRDTFLQQRGWHVARFRYDDLRYRPVKVREKLLALYESFQEPIEDEKRTTRQQMKRSGF